VAELSGSRASGAERFRQAGLKKAEAANDRPLAPESHKGQSASQEVHSQGRPPANSATITAGAKDVNSVDSSANAAAQPESATPDGGRCAAVSRLASDQTSMTGGSEGTAAKGSGPGVGEQIRDSVQVSLARGDRQVTIRLHPPELGSVLVRFREENEQIHGVLEVTRTDTQQQVEQALPQVLRSLQDSGVQIRRFEVTLADQPQENAGGQQPSEDARPQHGEQDQRAHWPDGPPGAGWSLESVEPQDSVDDPGNAAHAGTPARRINVLA